MAAVKHAPLSPILSTRGLSRSFGGLCAVDQIDFDLPTGETHALIGPNGAGKTTFVSLICGRLAADSGSIVFDGHDITKWSPHRRARAGLVYTFQITSIFPGLSAFDNVALAARRRLLDREGARVSAARVARLTEEALSAVGLSEYASHTAATLAYGHQRLLELAMVVALAPRLLVLDEPTQGLSDGEIKAFIALMRRLSADTTLLLIEHNMDVVMALAERITVLDRGSVLAQGTPDEIRTDASVQKAYLGG